MLGTEARFFSFCSPVELPDLSLSVLVFFTDIPSSALDPSVFVSPSFLPCGPFSLVFLHIFPSSSATSVYCSSFRGSPLVEMVSSYAIVSQQPGRLYAPSHGLAWQYR